MQRVQVTHLGDADSDELGLDRRPQVEVRAGAGVLVHAAVGARREAHRCLATSSPTS